MSNKPVQIHSDSRGPFRAEMSDQFVEPAESINQKPGFIWRIWTENGANHKAGSICLFQDKDTTRAYVEKHTVRLKHLGVGEVTFKIFDINEPLSRINHGHIS